MFLYNLPSTSIYRGRSLRSTFSLLTSNLSTYTSSTTRTYNKMTQRNMIINFCLCLLSITVAQAMYIPNGCKNLGSKADGATVQFYRYPSLDLATWKISSYLLGGYIKYGYSETVTGVTQLNFKSDATNLNSPYGASEFVPENYTMQITGYYLAPQSGTYKLALEADHYAAITLGDGEAFKCCNQDATFVSTHFVATNDLIAQEEIYLQENVLYPFKIDFVSNRNKGALQIGLNLPDGQFIEDIGAHLVTLKHSSEENCAQIIEPINTQIANTNMTTTT